MSDRTCRYRLAQTLMGLSLGASVACGSTHPPPATSAREPNDSAAALFARVEQRLLRAQPLHLVAALAAEGAVAAELTAELDIGEAAEHLSLQGTFANRPVTTQFRTSGGRLHIGETDTERPAHNRRALLIGLTRMGLLHNAARLTAGQGPDHADSGVEEWVTTSGHVLGGRQLRAGRTLQAISFDVVVSGEVAGQATLWVDAETLAPVERRQTVHFPQGDMHVLERYEPQASSAPPAESDSAG